jgi:hypothetical protein
MTEDVHPIPDRSLDDCELANQPVADDTPSSQGVDERTGRRYVHIDDVEDPSSGDSQWPLTIYTFGDDRVDELQDTLDTYRQQYVLATGMLLPVKLERVAPLTPREVYECWRVHWHTRTAPTVEDVRLVRGDGGE